MNGKLTPAELPALKREMAASLHCALPGTVESFDPETQTACIRPALKQRGILLPLIRDVPVFFPGSRESAVTWPVAAGDECLLVFADADLDRWFDGEDADPASDRRHSLSDAFAFVGFRSRRNALADFPDTPRFFDGAVPLHTHAAEDIASGTLEITRGGSGQGSTGSTNTIADIAAASSGCEITDAQYAWWGKVAMVRLVVKKTAAVSSGTTTLCTMVSGKRPKYAAAAVRGWSNAAMINTSGQVQVNGAISAGESVRVYSTFILA